MPRKSFKDVGSPSAQGPVSIQSRPSAIPYFYGRITREEAELFLTERGGGEGLFLLRESISNMGNYAISISHGGRVHHYSIEKQVDGLYKIPEGKAFPGPAELILHYQQHMDGFITQPKIACNRLPSQAPVAFRGITYYQLEKQLQLEAKKIGADMERAMGSMRDTLVNRVAATLHTDMPWYHGKISREDAEKRLKEEGHEQGKFLVRMRDDKDTFALTLSGDNQPRHYFIGHKEDGRYAIEDGPRFTCLMMLVDNYHNKSDGLACKLTQPCCRPGYSSIDYDQYMIHNLDRRSSVSVRHAAGAMGGTQDSNGKLQMNGRGLSGRRLPPLPAESRSPQSRPVPPTPDENPRSSGQDDTDHPEIVLDMAPHQLEEIYGSVRIEVISTDLRPEQVILEDKLGVGNFGSVMKGICKMRGKDVPVAVKTLKNAELDPTVEADLMKEANFMKELDHENIVRMIGVCKGESLMLVMELAKLGPLNKFLPKNKHLPLWNVVELMWQVAKGMAYLESKSYVHRDLAARNILLCDEHFAKISDFGMSKPLSRENNYYVAQTAGKWPLKWYAPECIHYWKFDSKSDVWSYGVTLWEAASYGAKPYHRMKGQEMVQFLEDGHRLAKPISCSDEVYDVMMSCWNVAREKRPAFKDLQKTMHEIFRSHKAAYI